MGTPTEGQLIRILDDIDDARASGGTAYVHCWGGVGRTGTVIGCWLVRHGLDRGDAVATIAALCAGPSLPRDRLPRRQPRSRSSASWRRGR